MSAKYRVFLIVLVFSLGLDQATKIWARHALRQMSPPVVTVVPGYFDLHYSDNPGIAFSLIRDVSTARPLFVLLGLLALVVIGAALRKAAPEQHRVAAELALIAGGALGNLADRLTVGPVTDFILWKAAGHQWPVFNIADAALVVGAIGLFFDLRAEPPAVADRH